MIYWAIAAVFAALVTGLAGGYFVGRYHASLLDRIRELKQPAKPEPPKPTVAGGSYSVQHALSPAPDTSRSAGLVETKTPEQLDWQNKQEIDKQALGY